MASLPPTAVSILNAARKLLAEQGFEGLTIEAVANEANVSRGLIPYHFGSRAGLIEILVDSLFHDFFVTCARRAPSESRRVSDVMDLMRDEVTDRGAYRDFFEILPHTLRKDDLRVRIAALYDLYRNLMLELAGAEPGSNGAGRPSSQALGALLLAIADGLGLQAALNPAFDIDEALLAARWLIDGRWSEERSS